MTPDSLKWIQFALRESVFKDCDKATANAIFSFADLLTTRHSLTSRRPSFWVLVRRTLDRPVLAALSRSATLVVPELDAFVPSRLGSTSPPAQTQALDERRLPPNSRKTQTPEEQKKNFYSWHVFLREAARLYVSRRDDSYTPEDQLTLATIDTLITFVSALSLAMPTTATVQTYNGQRIRQQALARTPPLVEYCELCWRSSMRCNAEKWFPKRLFNNSYSARFCIYHVPLDNPPPFNRYRTDIRYRPAFQREIVLRNQEANDNRPTSLISPVQSDSSDWRKASYDVVHSAVRPKPSSGQSSSECTPCNVFKYLQRGYSQKEIADDLGVSKQAVSATVRRIREIRTFHANEAEIDYATEEPFSLETQATWALLGKVKRLRDSGESTAAISRAVGRFKYTVQAIERWIDIIDAIRQHPGSSDLDEAVRLFIPPSSVHVIRERLRREKA